MKIPCIRRILPAFLALPLLAGPAHPSSAASSPPRPLTDHPGNVFLENEDVRVRLPKDLPASTQSWRLADDHQQVIRTGTLPQSQPSRGQDLPLGPMKPGWYRLDFEPADSSSPAWTTLAVLPTPQVAAPADTPIALDSAAAWFAPNDPEQQRRLANLAALAGVSWVRDRLRWGEIQPVPGALKAGPSSYDTSAEAHRAEGLQVLQVFHDTPAWARESPSAGGRFAPDLRVIHQAGRLLAERFRGRVAAWEPWNEANVETFGAHTVDQMCSWQKAAWLGMKAGDPDLIVGWNATAAVPTPSHTVGVIANETWPYYDTYNIHTYDGSHAYPDLWKPAREAAAGRPIWITEADRGTPHLKNPPWYDQAPRLERLKAEWMAQAYASSLFSGAARHFHFILGHYQEPNGVQFGLLRLDLTPRPAYVALAAVGRQLAGARCLGRWRPAADVNVYAFRARPDGIERDVLVAWAEKEVDWEGRGTTTADWKPADSVAVEEVFDYLGRSLKKNFPTPLTSAPVFVLLPPGQAAALPLESPPPLSPRRDGIASPIVLQLSLPRSSITRVEDLPWSEGHAYRARPGELLDLPLHVYNFSGLPAKGTLRVDRIPPNWELAIDRPEFDLPAGGRFELTGHLRLPAGESLADGWAVLRADCGTHGRPVLAFRVLSRP